MWHPQKAVNVLSLILITMFLAISVIVVQQTIFSKQEADEKNLLTFTATSPAVLKNKEFAIEVQVKKPDSLVQGVYFSLTYPSSKMRLVGIDDLYSAFDVQTEEITGNGLIKYGRDSSVPLSGDQDVATFKFLATDPVELSEFSVTGDASIVSPELKNIISTRPVVAYEKKDKSELESFFEMIVMIITDFPSLVLK